MDTRLRHVIRAIKREGASFVTPRHSVAGQEFERRQPPQAPFALSEVEGRY